MMQDFNTKRKYILKIICIICLCAFSHIDSSTSVRNVKTTDIHEKVLTVEEQARKSSEDTQVAGYARFEKVLAR